MKKKRGNTPQKGLRDRAKMKMETMAAWPEDLSKMSSQTMAKLIHELRVHQIELKMQNDELRIIQEELEKTRDRYSHLYDFSPVGYITITQKGAIIEANLTMTVMLGMERQSLIGSFFNHYIESDDQDIFYRLKKRLIKTEKNQFCRLRLVQKSHECFHASLECGLVEEKEGVDNQIRIVISDISEQKELENQLLESQKMEAIGTLAGGIAHDFNNILTAMIGFSELALEDVEKGSDLADNLGEILIGGNRAKLLVQQILMFCRKTNRTKILLRMDLLVEEVAKLLTSTIPADIDIDVIIGSKFPFVMGDDSQMHQVILNLCTNAIQAMKAKGGKLTIGIADIRLDHTMAGRFLDLIPGEYITLSIGDTGPGIPGDVKNRIFEPFFSTNDPSEGTGLGLAVVRGIVASHKGHITISSIPNKGTVFTVYLPKIGKLECLLQGEVREKKAPKAPSTFYLWMMNSRWSNCIKRS